VIAVHDHDGAQSQTHDEKGEGLQAIEIAQNVPPNRGDRLQQPAVGRKERKSQKTIAPRAGFW
jgi:hypothetical protein